MHNGKKGGDTCPAKKKKKFPKKVKITTLISMRLLKALFNNLNLFYLKIIN